MNLGRAASAVGPGVPSPAASCGQPGVVGGSGPSRRPRRGTQATPAAEHFIKQRGATRKQIDDTFARLTYTTDLAAAVRDADLISESVPESLAIKKSFWREASRHARAHTRVTTNTSILPPSALAGFVDRPRKFRALHFAIGVWDSNIGEAMGHPGTDSAVFERLLKFVDEIGLVPIPIRKEQNGYIINSLIVPWCTAALDLLVRGVSAFQR